MAVQMIIDTGSRADAERIAEMVPGGQAASWRGYGVIRLRFRTTAEARELLSVVRDAVEAYDLAWARVRIGDDETMFRRTRRSVANG